MADYVYISNYSNSGYLGISRKCFVSVANDAVYRMSKCAPDKENIDGHDFYIAKPIQVFFKNNGQVLLDISIGINKEADITKTCLAIQEEVTNALLISTESVPFKINIKVASVI